MNFGAHVNVDRETYRARQVQAISALGQGISKGSPVNVVLGDANDRSNKSPV